MQESNHQRNQKERIECEELQREIMRIKDLIKEVIHEELLTPLMELIQIGKPAVSHLIRLLDHENNEVVRRAAFTLGKIRDKRALEPLIKTLTRENQELRCEVAHALADMRNTKAIPALIELLKDERLAVKHAALVNLAELVKHVRSVKKLIEIAVEIKSTNIAGEGIEQQACELLRVINERKNKLLARQIDIRIDRKYLRKPISAVNERFRQRRIAMAI